MAGYVDNDDNTPYTFFQELDSTLKRLKNYTVKIFEWSYKNRFKLNVDKCNLIITSKSQEEVQIGKTSLTSVNRVKLLCIHTEGQLNLDYHVSQLCKEASKKLTL